MPMSAEEASYWRARREAKWILVSLLVSLALISPLFGLALFLGGADAMSATVYGVSVAALFLFFACGAGISERRARTDRPATMLPRLPPLR